jgi:trigger factor
MDIEITQKESAGVQRHIQVSVPAAAVSEAEDKAARRYASQARLPGFRPGKAPAAMVRKRFADAIRQETIEALVQEAYKVVLEREQLQVASQPHIHDLNFQPGQALTFELHVEVRPDIKLERTSGFTVARNSTAVTDEMVTEQLELLRDQKATWSPVDERPAPGDRVNVLLATADESGAMPAGKNYPLELGGGQAIAGIEELIMEATPGQTIERPVKWPDDFPDEAQRGQTKMVRVELTDVKRKTMPDLDDSFAREVGDFDSLDALRAAVRTDMEAHIGRESEADVRQKLIDAVLEANPFEVPPSWVEQMTVAYAQAYNIPETELPAFAEQFRAMAERQVRRDLVIDTLAEQHALKATESDVDDKVTEMATARGADVSQVYAALQKGGRLTEIERSVTEEKVFGWLTAQNTVQ